MNVCCEVGTKFLEFLLKTVILNAKSFTFLRFSSVIRCKYKKCDTAGALSAGRAILFSGSLWKLKASKFTLKVAKLLEGQGHWIGNFLVVRLGDCTDSLGTSLPKVFEFVISVVSTVSRTTIPQLLQKRVLHRQRSSASSFNLQHALVSLMPYSSC